MAVNIDLNEFEGLEEYGNEQTRQQQARGASSPTPHGSTGEPRRISRRSSSGLSSSPSSSSGGLHTPPTSGRSDVFAGKSNTVRKRSGSTGGEVSGLPFADVLDNRMRFYQENYECPFCKAETKTFEQMKSHIALDHPWFDLSMHQNIR
ncbi:hypothetical protein LPJ73_003966 [Coemansia sp. RSA 2703]|nr:hypothetical protein LPJ73_003966 [Coemansia sp. RSA 2703]KAJ2389877.1 hypothetical protein GGI05_003370 [Coemansia sp. RSA 2603]